MLNVELRNVAVQYDAYPAVEDISFDVPGGQFVAIVGPTGCGKSSLLNVVAGLLPTARGRVCTAGRLVGGFENTLPAPVPGRAGQGCGKGPVVEKSPANPAEGRAVQRPGRPDPGVD